MKINLFIYIISNLIIFQLISLQNELICGAIYLICIFGVFSIGLAHGSIDNVLAGAKSGKENYLFIVKYLIIVFCFGVLWMFTPNIALIFFLIVSAYHFGQSQLVDYNFKPIWLSKLMYISWGGFVLFSMFYFGNSKMLLLQQNHLSFLSIINYLIENSFYFLLVFSFILITTFLSATILKRISINDFFKEFYIMVLLIISFKVLPTFIAFSLFFVWVHSLKVMLQEYEFCKRKLEIKNQMQFFKLLLPLTIVSLLGIGFVLLAIIQYNYLEFIPYVLLIMLSCVTIPHAFVMDRFYG